MSTNRVHRIAASGTGAPRNLTYKPPLIGNVGVGFGKPDVGVAVGLG